MNSIFHVLINLGANLSILRKTPKEIQFSYNFPLALGRGGWPFWLSRECWLGCWMLRAQGQPEYAPATALFQIQVVCDLPLSSWMIFLTSQCCKSNTRSVDPYFEFWSFQGCLWCGRYSLALLGSNNQLHAALSHAILMEAANTAQCVVWLGKDTGRLGEFSAFFTVTVLPALRNI
jgi:hypothetical protein